MTFSATYLAVLFASAVPWMSCQAETIYVTQNNAVYTTEARELPWNDALTLPLALRDYPHHLQVMVIYQKIQRTVVEVDSTKLQELFHDPSLKFESLLVSGGRVYQKVGRLHLFKQYATDALANNVDVTPFPRRNRILVTVAPRQKNGFEGSTCIVTDISTRDDVHIAPRISEVYTNFQDTLTWISDNTVLAFEYTYRGSGGYYIDTKKDTRTHGYQVVDKAQYFSFDGSKLTLFLLNGDHFDTKVATNFASNLPSFPHSQLAAFSSFPASIGKP